MDAKELRIGNELLNGTVVSLSKDEVIVNDGYQDWKQSRFKDGFEPIPLTEEWLLKFGFEEEYKSSVRKLLTLLNEKSEFIFTYTFHHSQKTEFLNWGGRNIYNIKHVHQLQNLYYALCQEELTIK